MREILPAPLLAIRDQLFVDALMVRLPRFDVHSPANNPPGDPLSLVLFSRRGLRKPYTHLVFFSMAPVGIRPR
jgi:hypothetical protein